MILATLLHCRTGQKIRTEEERQNGRTKRTELCLVYVSDLDFPTNLLLKWSFEQNRRKLRNKQHFNGFACVVYVRFLRILCNRYNARWISKTKSQNTRKWRNGEIINPLFDGLIYNTSGHFGHCSYFSSPLRGSEKYFRSQNIRAYYMLNHRIMCINSQK